ncbi:MAG: hypothetical protein JNL41_14615 [Phenylobacterium sp.]|uniref:hypothetical protein n=1 Tax=Phenylobacterium sp. TaxID=1871053 RepID=UPI001A3CA20D|nr:hypothetical protein [Phenylobacterium sp.]MBL8555504.1 hypothetical protein [Phenylobacterium sp.]
MADRDIGMQSGVWRAGLLFCAALGLAAGFAAVVAFLHAAATGLLGKPQVDAWVVGDHSVLAGWLGAASAIANIMVAVIAWYAIRFARNQAIEANRARVATLYAEVHKMWNAADFTQSRDLVRALTHEYDRKLPEFDEQFGGDATKIPTKAQYIATILISMRDADRKTYNKYTKCLDILEYFGAACRREIMDWEMLMEMYGGQVGGMSAALTEFCLQLQVRIEAEKYGHASSVYANALWLFDRNETYAPFRFQVNPKHLLPIPGA